MVIEETSGLYKFKYLLKQLKVNMNNNKTKITIEKNRKDKTYNYKHAGSINKKTISQVTTFNPCSRLYSSYRLGVPS